MCYNIVHGCCALRFDEFFTFSTNPATNPGLRWSDLGLCPWDWSTRYCTNHRERPSLLDLLSEFGLISDGWLGSISLWRLGQCTWVLKVSVLETGHTRYCSISGRDPLRQSYRLCHGYCRKTPTTNQIQPHAVTRSKSTVPLCKSNTRKNFFDVRVVPIWDFLSQQIHSANSPAAFKNQITKSDFSLFFKFSMRFLTALTIGVADFSGLLLFIFCRRTRDGLVLKFCFLWAFLILSS